MTLQEALDVAEHALFHDLFFDDPKCREAAALLERARPFLAASLELCAAWVNADIGPNDLAPCDAAVLAAYRTLVEPADGEKG